MTNFHQLLVSAVLLSLSFAVACSRQVDTSDAGSEQQALLVTDRAWADAARKGDIPHLTSFWEDDAINYFPGVPPAKGKEAISRLVEMNRNRPGFSLSWEPETAVVARSGDLGYTSGTFELTGQDPEGNPATRTGHYVCIWRKQSDGTWKCSLESTIFGPNPE